MTTQGRTIGLCLAALLCCASACTKEVTVEIGSIGDTMTYDKKELVVPAGSRVTLVLRNGAKAPAMVHNWVLLRPGNIDEVGRDAITVPAALGYIPDNPAILAYTSLVKPGESGTVRFRAPAAGTYDYICTVPGHYTTMRGVLIVK